MSEKQIRVTRQQAIDAKCKDCSYDNLAGGTWREQVALCPCLKCALWPYRPFPISGEAPEGSLSPTDGLYARTTTDDEPKSTSDKGSGE